MKGLLRFGLLAVWLCCVLVLPAQAKRLALVIGNDNYLQVAKLDKAGNDADAMARELSAAGFEVMKYRDLDFKGTVRAFESFYDRIAGGDEVAIFYAGHGVQTKTGSYLLPIDIEGETESQVEKTSYSVNALLEELEKAKPRFSLVVIDACRDNPLRSRGRTIGAAKGLTPPDVAKGQMIVFSAGRGQQALDRLREGDPNPNGVFTREFIARMKKPGVSVEALALEVRTAVENLASTVGHNQRPYFINEASGVFYFVAPLKASEMPSGVVVTPVISGAAAVAPVESTREEKFWDEVKGLDNIDGYEAYLGAYPSGRYAALGRAHIARIKARQDPATARLPAPASAANPAMTAPRDGAAASSASTSQTVSTVVAAVAKPPSPPSAGAERAVVPDARPQSPATSPIPMPASATESSPTETRTMVTLANGDRYEGDVVGVVRSGRGRYLFSNGDKYEGEFSGNRFHGKGTMTFANGDRYEGGYANNLFDGAGSFIYASGDRYDGAFVGGIKQGVGVYKFANGDRYEGEFKNNAFNGKGRLNLSGGEYYEGDFQDGKKDGKGVHHFTDKIRYEGEFKGGLQSGNGTHFYANGDRYTGLFSQGVRNGKGVHHFVSGETKSLEFVNGVEKSQ